MFCTSNFKYLWLKHVAVPGSEVNIKVNGQSGTAVIRQQNQYYIYNKVIFLSMVLETAVIWDSYCTWLVQHILLQKWARISPLEPGAAEAQWGQHHVLYQKVPTMGIVSSRFRNFIKDRKGKVKSDSVLFCSISLEQQGVETAALVCWLCVIITIPNMGFYIPFLQSPLPWMLAWNWCVWSGGVAPHIHHTHTWVNISAGCWLMVYITSGLRPQMHCSAFWNLKLQLFFVSTGGVLPQICCYYLLYRFVVIDHICLFK